MAAVVLVTIDPNLLDRVRNLPHAAGATPTLQIVSDRTALHNALTTAPQSVLFDLNVCQALDVLACVREVKDLAANAQLVVFLDHLVGDLPVRAKLAGADRVVPRAQLERELAALLGR